MPTRGSKRLKGEAATPPNSSSKVASKGKGKGKGKGKAKAKAVAATGEGADAGEEVRFVLGGGEGEAARVRAAAKRERLARKQADKDAAAGGAAGAGKGVAGKGKGKLAREPMPPSEEELALERSLFGSGGETLASFGLGHEVDEWSKAAGRDAGVDGDGDGGSQDGDATGAGAGAGSGAGAGAPVSGAAKRRRRSSSAGDGGSGSESDASRSGGRGSGGEGGDGSAWHDDDDEDVIVDIAKVNRLRKLRSTQQEGQISGTEYSKRLRQQFAKTNPGRAWADAPSASGSAGAGDGSGSAAGAGAGAGAGAAADDVAALLRSTAPLLGGSTTLRPGRLNMTRLKDANYRDPCGSVVSSARFHPQGRVMLTAGLDKRVRFFQVDGKDNTRIQSVFFPDLPVYSAEFSGDGHEVIASGRRPFFYSIDVHTGSVHKVARIIGRDERSLERCVVSPDSQLLAFLGNDGYIILVSNKSKQWVANLKMNSPVRAAAFTADGSELLSTGVDGEVYRWDLRTRRAVVRHKDEGSMCGCAIAVSQDSRYYAVGSDMGVVNVYDSADVARHVAETTASSSVFGSSGFAHPSPRKSLLHLTTPVDHLEFNHDSQVLAMGSQRIKDSLKLVHLPSFSVFSNWPTSKTPLHYVTSLAFSPHSGYLSVGNDRGRVLLYRLNHFLQA